MSEYKLFSEICRLSSAGTWTEARLEWQVKEYSDLGAMEGECLCGHPIRIQCHIINVVTQAIAILGNCCIKKFETPQMQMSENLRKLRLGEVQSMNEITVALLHEANVLNTWEFDYYLDIKNKRKLSVKQAAKKEQIHMKALTYAIHR